MRFLLCCFLFLIAYVPSHAQTYGNEWIDYNQKYFKFGITENGVYRIPYQSLVDAGVPVNTVASNKYQIFGKEKEIPLKVVDNGDNLINVGDYIEFYAQ